MISKIKKWITTVPRHPEFLFFLFWILSGLCVWSGGIIFAVSLVDISSCLAYLLHYKIIWVLGGFVCWFLVAALFSWEILALLYLVNAVMLGFSYGSYYLYDDVGGSIWTISLCSLFFSISLFIWLIAKCTNYKLIFSIVARDFCIGGFVLDSFNSLLWVIYNYLGGVSYLAFVMLTLSILCALIQGIGVFLMMLVWVVDTVVIHANSIFDIFMSKWAMFSGMKRVLHLSMMIMFGLSALQFYVLYAVFNMEQLFKLFC